MTSLIGSFSISLMEVKHHIPHRRRNNTFFTDQISEKETKLAIALAFNPDVEGKKVYSEAAAGGGNFHLSMDIQ